MYMSITNYMLTGRPKNIYNYSKRVIELYTLMYVTSVRVLCVFVGRTHRTARARRGARQRATRRDVLGAQGEGCAAVRL